MQNIKRLISSLLVVIMLMTTMITAMPVVSNAVSGLSLQQLREKFPDGKYWNHAGKPGASNSVNNQNGYTSTPCSKHGVVGTSQQTCNGFQPGNSQLSWQCMGYAEKLGYDVTGYNPRNDANGWQTYYSLSALDSLKPGDIVQYKNGGHTIYVIGVEGDTVIYTDCNSDNQCVIEWDKKISKSTLKSSFKMLRSAPWNLLNNSGLDIDTSYKTPIYAHINSCENVQCYNYVNGSAAGYVYPSDECIILEVYTNGWCKFECPWPDKNNMQIKYAPVSIFKINKEEHAEVPQIRRWFSTTEYGDSISELVVGNTYYSCYRIFDPLTGKDWDEVADNSYSVKLEIYNPDGSLNHGYTDYDDRGWVRIFYTEPGTYTRKITVSGDFTNVFTSTFNVKADPKKMHSSENNITLKLGVTESKTINVWSTGYHNNSTLFNWKKDNNHVSCSWGEWTDGKLPLTITANSVGTSTVTLSVKDEDSGEILDSITVTVTVSAKTYTVSYNANGGTGAPASQTKSHNTDLTLTEETPTGKSYTVYFDTNGGTISSNSKVYSDDFSGWNTLSSGNGTTYSSGATYSGNTNITLYAMWSKPKLINTPAPKKDGYYFIGWYDSTSVDEDGLPTGNKYDKNSAVSSNMTLYAMWSKADTLYMGDYNLDGTVDFKDVVGFNRVKLEKVENVDDEMLFRGDLNRNYVVDDDDLVMINQLRLNKLSQDDVLDFTGTFIGMMVNTLPNKSIYQLGEIFEIDGLSIVMAYEDCTYVIDKNLFVDGYDPNKIGKQTLTVSYYQFNTTLTVYVEEPPCEHRFTQYISNSDYTCTKDGTKTAYCDYGCGESDTKTDVGSALGHTDEYATVTKKATCLEDGTESICCGRCNSVIYTNVIAATGHVTGLQVTTKTPTCTDDGVMTTYCQFCGVSMSTTTISASGHSWGETIITEATCTEEASYVRTCSECGLVDKKFAPALGHTPGDSVETKTPTCISDGTATIYCSVCGEVVFEESIAMIGHTWSDWIQISAPTTTAEGQQLRYCKVCKTSETEIIPKLDEVEPEPEDPVDPNAPAVVSIDNYTVSLDKITDIKEIRFAIGHYTKGSEIKAAEKNVTLDASTVKKYTVDGVMTYDLPWMGEYTFWVRYNDGSQYFVYTSVDDITPYVESYGVKITVKDYAENYKDMWLAEGSFNSYSEIKASTGFKYQASASKLDLYTKTTHDFSYIMTNPGPYTVLIRYNDGSVDVIHHELTVDYPEFSVNGLQITVTNIPDIKIIRTAPGHYTSVADIKKAAGVRNFNNKIIKDEESYMLQYRDAGEVTLIVEYNNGYKHFYYHNIEPKSATMIQSKNTVMFDDLDGFVMIRYAKGVYSTSTQIKAAEGSKVLKPADLIGGYAIIPDLEKGTYTFCVQFDDESYDYYMVTVE